MTGQGPMTGDSDRPFKGYAWNVQWPWLETWLDREFHTAWLGFLVQRPWRSPESPAWILFCFVYGRYRAKGGPGRSWTVWWWGRRLVGYCTRDGFEWFPETYRSDLAIGRLD